MPYKLRYTTDLGTGTRFAYNETARYLGFIVPSWCGKNDSRHLHPARVNPALLAALNEGRALADCEHVALTLHDQCRACGKLPYEIELGVE